MLKYVYIRFFFSKTRRGCSSSTEVNFFVGFYFQELIDVDSEVVFELASYILQVSWSLLICVSQGHTPEKEE